MRLHARASELAKSFRGTRLAHYENWNFVHLPQAIAADASFFTTLGDQFAKKTGVLDIGFGWRVGDASRLERDEVLDAFAELEPLYRVLRAVS